jgi:hypothetical protein
MLGGGNKARACLSLVLLQLRVIQRESHLGAFFFLYCYDSMVLEARLRKDARIIDLVAFAHTEV